MPTRKVVSLGTTTISDPNAELVHRGFDAEGNAILCKSSIRVPPFQVFEFDDGAELQQLINIGAVRLLTDMEVEQGIDVGDSVPPQRRAPYAEFGT